MSIVFLCVGAAKAGTSWLHRQLSEHPECHFRAIKELHYFNALENGRLSDELKKHRAQQVDLLERLALSEAAPNGEQARRLTDRGAWIDVLERRQEDTGAYLDYLRDGAAHDVKVVGEMTPAYALLPASRLRAMAKMDADVRFLYLLRDPVDRLWSHVRMIAGRRAPDGEVTEERCAWILDRTLRGAEDQIVMRCDYAGAIERLKSVVDPARLLFEVFEEVVRGDGMERICDFLGIGRFAADPIPVHEGSAIEMTAEQRRAASAWLAPQYEAAQATLGRSPGRWATGDL